MTRRQGVKWRGRSLQRILVLVDESDSRDRGMERALVCGAGGFIASHVVKRLKAEGYWVRGVDIKHPEFSPTAADEFRILDLRELPDCEQALRVADGPRAQFEEVYQLAADMGGMGFIHSAECE